MVGGVQVCGGRGAGVWWEGCRCEGKATGVMGGVKVYSGRMQVLAAVWGECVCLIRK